MSPTKVVVTGATGHLGRYVASALAAGGAQVVAFSRSGALPRAPFGAPPTAAHAVPLDIEREEAADVLAPHLGPEVALVHLAAWHPPATAKTTAADRARLLEANVFGTLRVLDAARRAGARVVVYASTFEVYGVPTEPGPVTEDARLNPISDYGATKLSGEDHLLAFAYEQRTRVIALRMPAIYGPGELTARALPNFLKRVAVGERPHIVGGGGDLRDQLHARDAALAVERALGATASGIFNVADGQPHSIESLATIALRVAGMSGEPSREPSSAPRYDFHMSIQRARETLGFEPQVPLEAGMAEQLAWLRAGAPS